MAAAVDVGLDGFVAAGVRCASVQWSTRPVLRRQLAVGDAAVALNPLAGQGVRFGLSSALAAAAVVRTWADGGSDSLAHGYYQSFVDGVRTRHLANLAEIQARPDAAAPIRLPALQPDRRLKFCASSKVVGQNRGGRFVAEECFVVGDGGLVRSVAGVDLAWLRDAASGQPGWAQVAGALRQHGVADDYAHLVVGWALRNGVLEVVH